jgi:RNA polymerase sigma-70 factor (ECF subfamily)
MDSQAAPQMQNNKSAYEELPDDVLVRECQQGDNQAFAELMKRHEASATKLALSILRDRADAEDEVQTAFWKAYEHIGQFQQDAKFSTWFTRIVVNQCLMRLRQTRRARFYYVDDTAVGDEVVTLDLPDHSLNPEERLGQTEIGEVLQDEIRRIPPLLRYVFLLRDIEQRPMPDVAAELGISVAAAKSRLLRARAELRNRLQRHYGRLGPATLLVS